MPNCPYSLLADSITMFIRPAQARDLDECLALDNAYETDYVWQIEINRKDGQISAGFRVSRLPRAVRVAGGIPREQLLEHLERGQCFQVSEHEGIIVGFLDATVNPWKRILHINQVTVAPDSRRHGVGGQLLRSALTWGRDQRLSTAMAELPTKNYPAASLLQKHGFEFCGYNDRYYTNRDIALYFALRLR